MFVKRIFICHSSKDAGLASKVCKLLEKDGTLCWIAPRDIPYGKPWAGEIAKSVINHTSLFMFLLSENSNKSKQVLKEITLAINYDIPMLIIRCEPVELNPSLSYYLSDLHIYDCISGNKKEKANEIANLIRKKETKKRTENQPPSPDESMIGPKIMSIIGEDGSLEQVEVILAFEFKDTKKEYVIYTKHEKDQEDNVTVYVSSVDRTTGEPKLMGVEDEKEWDRVKEVLLELSTDDDGSPHPPHHPPKFGNDGIEIL